MILAEDLERLVDRRASFLNEIIDALLRGYQFFPLLKRRLASEYERRQALIHTKEATNLVASALVRWIWLGLHWFRRISELPIGSLHTHCLANRMSLVKKKRQFHRHKLA